MDGPSYLLWMAVLALAIFIVGVLVRFATVPRDPMPTLDPIVFEVAVPQ